MRDYDLQHKNTLEMFSVIHEYKPKLPCKTMLLFVSNGLAKPFESVESASQHAGHSG